ncbi:uncharacterized protein [Palaemon carinicauda]|uniref:uncharacterized protein n=1 Tax=Palaemon carinicauda TaxID=392227 RepID=UPI0035B5EBD9
MENQNAGAGQKPLTFDSVEDIPDIDDEKMCTSSDVTSAGVTSSINPVGEKVTTTEEAIQNEKTITQNVKEDFPSNVYNREVTETADLLSINDNKNICNDEDKMQEISCADDTSVEAVTSNTSEIDAQRTEECVTHSLSFAFRPTEDKCASKEETDSNIGEKVAESQELQESKSKVKSKTKKVKKVTNKDSRDSDSSVSSKKKGKSNKTQIKSKFAPGSFEYIEERLRGHMFSGWIEERKWVENLAGYRDIVEVDEWEVEINQILMCVIRSIPGVLEGKKWINITPPSDKEPCYCLWTLLPTPPNPGHYWFSVTGVSIHPQFGLRVMLKIIRSIHPHDGELAKARRQRRKQLAAKEPGSELETLSEQVQEWLLQIRQISLSSVWSAVSSTLTISNIKEAFRFVIVLSMTLVVGIVAFVRESHHYGIQFLHASGVFFRNITPFMQSLLAFFEKIIGGMYLLIAMVYNDMRRSAAQSPQLSAPPPAAIADGRQGFIPPPPGQRTVKYVPPEQWVYRSQSSPTADS